MALTVVPMHTPWCYLCNWNWKSELSTSYAIGYSTVWTIVDLTSVDILVALSLCPPVIDACQQWRLEVEQHGSHQSGNPCIWTRSFVTFEWEVSAILFLTDHAHPFGWDPFRKSLYCWRNHGLTWQLTLSNPCSESASFWLVGVELRLNKNSVKICSPHRECAKGFQFFSLCEIQSWYGARMECAERLCSCVVRTVNVSKQVASFIYAFVAASVQTGQDHRSRWKRELVMKAGQWAARELFLFEEMSQTKLLKTMRMSNVSTVTSRAKSNY